MTAAALVAALRSRGVELVPAGDRLRFRPASKVPPELLESLRERKAEVLVLLLSAQTSDLLAMPLDAFAYNGQPVEVRVSWWPVTLWFVPDARHAEALSREGIAQSRVWTAAELISLLSAAPLTTEGLLTVMHARAAFGGEVVRARSQ